MTIPAWFEIVFLLVAVIASGFFGFFCFEIHNLDRSAFKWQEKIQQVWFNFVGALIGWIALWILVRQWWGAWRLPTAPGVPVQMTVSDFGLALIAFVGISGYLPFTVMGVIRTFVALVQKVVERLTDLLSSAKKE